MHQAADIIKEDNTQPQYNTSNGTLVNVTSSGAAVLSTVSLYSPNATATVAATTILVSVSIENYSAIFSKPAATSSITEISFSSSPNSPLSSEATSIRTGFLFPGSPNSPLSSKITSTATGFLFPGSPNSPLSSEAASTTTGFLLPVTPKSPVSLEVASTRTGFLYPGSPNSPLSSETLPTGFSQSESPHSPVSSATSTTDFLLPGSPSFPLASETVSFSATATPLSPTTAVGMSTASSSSASSDEKAVISSYIAFLNGLLAPSVASEVGPMITADSFPAIPTSAVNETSSELEADEEATLESLIKWLMGFFGGD